MSAYVLLGSVFLPACAFDALAGELRGRGHDVRIAVPRATGDAPVMLGDYRDVVSRDGSPVIVAHSNAGNFVPDLVRSTAAGAAVFMDAVLPPLEGGAWRIVPAGLAEALAARSRDGILPPWTRWWPRADVEALLPSPAGFHALDAQAPSVPAAYLTTTLEAAAGWADGLSAGYLAFGDTYADEIARARAAGWPIGRLALGHLGMMRRPDAVGDAIEAITEELRISAD